MKSHLFFLVIICLLAFSNVFTSKASCDSTNVYCRPNFSNDSIYKIRYIGHLNFDCYLDTLIISSSKKNADTLKISGTFFPKYVFWGRCQLPRDSAKYCPCYDSLGIPDSQKVWYTRIDYPFMYEKRAATTVFRYNNDEAHDIITFFWGKTRNDSAAKDTSMVVSLFGQSALDTVLKADLGDVDSLTTDPYFCLRLRPNVHFVDSARRDFMGRLSYIIPPLQLNVGNSYQQNNNQNQMIMNDVEGEVYSTFEVFPNPARDAITVKYTGDRHSSELQVVITEHTGKEMLRMKLPCMKFDNCEQTISLGKIASGLYSVRIIDHNNQYLFTKNIIIVR